MIRKEFPDGLMADLYDPIAMPPKLVKAHKELDKAVDACYIKQVFTTDMIRLGFLLALLSVTKEGSFCIKNTPLPCLGRSGEKKVILTNLGNYFTSCSRVLAFSVYYVYGNQ